MSFADTWTSADPDAGPSSNTEPPEPGLYAVHLADARAFTSNAGNEVMILTWKVNTSGREWDVLYGFKNQGQANIAASAVKDLGLDPKALGSLADIDAAIATAKGNYYDVEVVQNGQYRNSYIRGRFAGDSSLDAAVTSGAVETEPATLGGVDIDSVPF